MLRLLFLIWVINLTATPLFVSLGPDCLPAGMFRHWGFRKAAFPFDWMRTLDNEGLLEALNNRMQDFTNETYLIKDPIEGQNIIHSKYHMEFSHDWMASYWGNESLFREGMAKLKDKYDRRVNRFLSLDHSNEEVVFFRMLRPEYNLSAYAHLYWLETKLKKDTKKFAAHLYAALKSLFPNLKFKLILIDKASAEGKMELAPNITIYYLAELENHAAWEVLLKQLFSDSF